MLFFSFFSQNWTKCPGQDLEVCIQNADLISAYVVLGTDGYIHLNMILADLYRSQLQGQIIRKSIQILLINNNQSLQIMSKMKNLY